MGEAEKGEGVNGGRAFPWGGERRDDGYSHESGSVFTETFTLLQHSRSCTRFIALVSRNVDVPHRTTIRSTLFTHDREVRKFAKNVHVEHPPKSSLCR